MRNVNIQYKRYRQFNH